MANGNSSNFNFGNVGGSVEINQAGGDVVKGDKITTTTTSIGFQQEADKQQFVDHVETLRTLLRELKSEIETSKVVNADDRDDFIMELMAELRDLRTVKETAEQTPVGKPPPAETQSTFEKYLQKTESFMDKAAQFGEKAAELAIKVSPLVGKALPLLLQARRLFGIP